MPAVAARDKKFMALVSKARYAILRLGPNAPYPFAGALDRRREKFAAASCAQPNEVERATSRKSRKGDHAGVHPETIKATDTFYALAFVAVHLEILRAMSQRSSGSSFVFRR